MFAKIGKCLQIFGGLVLGSIEADSRLCGTQNLRWHRLSTSIRSSSVLPKTNQQAFEFRRLVHGWIKTKCSQKRLLCLFLRATFSKFGLFYIYVRYLHTYSVRFPGFYNFHDWNAQVAAFPVVKSLPEILLAESFFPTCNRSLPELHRNQEIHRSLPVFYISGFRKFNWYFPGAKC